MRDYLTTVVSQRELYDGLVQQGVVQQPSKLEELWANDVNQYNLSLGIQESYSKQVKPFFKSVWNSYTNTLKRAASMYVSNKPKDEL